MNDKQQLAAMGERMREIEERKPEFKVPEGWRMVPVKPNSDMLDELTNGDAKKRNLFKLRYQAMLAAAPEYKP